MATKESLHSVSQLVQSEDFIVYTDLIKTLLDPTKLYSKQQVWNEINKFLKQEVK